MKISFSITALLFFCRSVLYAQQPGFEDFAIKQDSLFTKAYRQQNIPVYLNLLDSFTSRYTMLTMAEQKQFAGYAQNSFYNLSCIYSLLHKNKEALTSLEKAMNSGYSDYHHVLEDRDLDNIRTEKKYVQLLRRLQTLGDYQYILKTADRYDSNDRRPVPIFTYQPDGHPDLKALRKSFNLDSIAGQGNDVLKIINLLHWVHAVVPHDGNHPNPLIKNAMSLIDVCKRDHRGLNCRGLATVLNECYLAMGFKSRFITCLPKDSSKTDPDCHVINAVYSPSLKKWLWMDPTNDAYVMDEHGVLLSIQEVRERIVNNNPLILNPDANWNNRFSRNKEEYLYNYMAKNLYLLQCGINSEYDAETPENGKTVTYITLVPVAYFDQQKNSREEKNEKSGSVYRYFQTNNTAGFWQSPVNQ